MSGMRDRERERERDEREGGGGRSALKKLTQLAQRALEQMDELEVKKLTQLGMLIKMKLQVKFNRSTSCLHSD